MTRPMDERAADAAAVVAGPGDTLIVGIHPAITAEEANRLSSAIGDELGGIRVAVIDNCSGFAVRKGTEP